MPGATCVTIYTVSWISGHRRPIISQALALLFESVGGGGVNNLEGWG